MIFTNRHCKTSCEGDIKTWEYVFVIGLRGSLQYGILLINQEQAVEGKFQVEFIIDVQIITQYGKVSGAETNWDD